ncbi:9883_t:CDS:1, partial [Rhizophagus irregularis]
MDPYRRNRRRRWVPRRRVVSRKFPTMLELILNIQQQETDVPIQQALYNG